MRIKQTSTIRITIWKAGVEEIWPEVGMLFLVIAEAFYTSYSWWSSIPHLRSSDTVGKANFYFGSTRKNDGLLSILYLLSFT